MQRRSFILGAGAGVAALAPFLARAQAGRPPLQPLPIELVQLIDQVPGRVTLGNPKGDARLVEFFDYNCLYCRRSARELRALLSADRDLSYVLVNYAVLGAPSVEATRIALAFSRQKADRYLEFHETLFSKRGTVGLDHALETALALGADKTQLIEDADSDAVTNAMIAAVRLGEAFGFQATPSYVVGTEGLQGYFDATAKRIVVANLRACEKAFC